MDLYGGGLGPIRRSKYQDLMDKLGPFALGFGAVFFVFLVCFLVMLGIDFLSEIGSRGAFDVLSWFRGAGFGSQWEFTNFLKLFLLAAFIGWVINRFRRR